MKDDNCSRLRIARAVQAPVVAGVIGFDSKDSSEYCGMMLR